jgi:hypothetical protein
MRTTPSTQPAHISSAGVIWIKLAVLYLMVGVSIGITMGVRQDFTLRPVHAHVNLLGWTTLALAGLIYSLFPKAGDSVLAKIHFWTMNLAMPVMLGSLAYMLLTGDMKIVPVLGVSEVTAAVSIVAFAANLFLNLRVQPDPAQVDVQGEALRA